MAEEPGARAEVYLGEGLQSPSLGTVAANRERNVVDPRDGVNQVVEPFSGLSRPP